MEAPGRSSPWRFRVPTICRRTLEKANVILGI